MFCLFVEGFFGGGQWEEVGPRTLMRKRKKRGYFHYSFSTQGLQVAWKTDVTGVEGKTNHGAAIHTEVPRYQWDHLIFPHLVPANC